MEAILNNREHQLCIYAESRKFWSNGRILHQRTLFGKHHPFCSSFHIFILEVKVAFDGVGHIRVLP